MAPKNYCLEHSKSIFNEHEILNLSNLYVHQTFLTMYKVMKDHTPIAIYDIFKMSSRDNFLVKLPSVHLNVSQCNFVSRCSLLWNKLIGKVIEKSKPESDGALMPGSAENSDFCAPVPFVKTKLRNILLTHQKAGHPYLWEPSNFCVT